MNRARNIVALAVVLLAAISCAQPVGHAVDAAFVRTMPSPWPTPEVRTPNAPPRILAVWMNETGIAPGSVWTGRIVTSTNVGSVEIRTESFSFVADRSAFGEFTFKQRILDVVAQYHRAYTLQIVARNTPGDRDVWLVPIVIE